MKRVPENVHSIFDSFTISVITPQLLWVGIAGGNSGSIPGDDADVVSAKLEKKSAEMARLRGNTEWDGERRGNSGGDEDERGNEGYVHRVIKLRHGMGSCEKIGWEVEC